MAQNVQVCEIPTDVSEKLKKFRFRKDKTIAAKILKIDKDKMEVKIDEEFEEVALDELQAELPEHQPSYVVLSYILEHGDRTSYPLCFIYICPSGCKPEQAMMYAGTKSALQEKLGLTKAFELRSVDDFTEEWLVEKLRFFR